MGNLFFLDDNLFDSHCHLNDSSFDFDRDQVVQAAVDAGVTKVIDIAIDLDSSQRAIDNAKKYPGVVFASVGIDPDLLIPGNKSFAENIQKPTSYWEEQIESLRKLISENKNYVVAIGETGMDAYWLEREMKEGKVDFATTKKSIQVQEELFRMHLQLASEVDLPLSIHSRAAEPACLEIIGNFSAARISGVFHSYTGDYETAVKILDAGWALGVNGIITFKNAEDLREMYRKIIGKVTSDLTPADLYSKGIYLETDAPYLAPEGKRGERNNPGNVSQIFTDFIEALKK